MLKSGWQVNPGTGETPAGPHPDPPAGDHDTWFRYTGDSFLTVPGFLNARVYRFSKQTPELKVVADDVSLMRGYSDLRETGGTSS